MFFHTCFPTTTSSWMIIINIRVFCCRDHVSNLYAQTHCSVRAFFKSKLQTAFWKQKSPRECMKRWNCFVFVIFDITQCRGSHFQFDVAQIFLTRIMKKSVNKCLLLFFHSVKPQSTKNRWISCKKKSFSGTLPKCISYGNSLSKTLGISRPTSPLASLRRIF